MAQTLVATASESSTDGSTMEAIPSTQGYPVAGTKHAKAVDSRIRSIPFTWPKCLDNVYAVREPTTTLSQLSDPRGLLRLETMNVLVAIHNAGRQLKT